MDDKIYTKQGDNGETTSLGGERLSKNSPLITACGELDELNASLGFAGSMASSEIGDLLRAIQQKIFIVTARISAESKSPDLPNINESYISHLESIIDHLTAQLPPLHQFIVPGQTPAGGAISLARAICRRAERSTVALGNVEPIILQFINRLSDLLFVLERYEYHLAGQEERKWN